MATNPPKGDGHRNGAVRERSQFENQVEDRMKKSAVHEYSASFSIVRNKENESREIDRLFNALCCAFDEFVNSMLTLQGYSKLILEVAKRRSFTSKKALFGLLGEVIKDASRKHGETIAKLLIKVTDKNNGKSFEKKFDIYDNDIADKIIKVRETYNDTAQILRRNFIQELTNIWERLIGSLLKAKLVNEPRSIDSSIKISPADVINCGTYENILNLMTERSIKDFLMSDLKDQMTELKKAVGVDFSNYVGHEMVKHMEVLFLRRNLFVHCGGVATREFISKTHEKVSVGEKIELTDEYINRSWDLIYTIGAILSHSVLAHYAKDIKNEEQDANAMFYLSNAACEAISSCRFDSAIKILEYAEKRAVKNVSCQLAVHINLALAYKRVGMKKELLRTVKWLENASCSNLFKACICALKDDYSTLYRVLKILAKEKPDFIIDLYSWPVFDELRVRDDFAVEVKDLWPECEKVANRERFSKMVDSCDEFLPTGWK